MRKPARLVLCLVLLGGFAYLFQDSILLMVGNLLIIQDPLQKADVIHVISGLDYRTNYAVQLYKQGYGKYLFFTGGWCPEIMGVHAERSTALSIRQGVPADVIKADPFPVTSTYQEAQRLKHWIDQEQMSIHSVIIVSDPHHMRRARWAYQQVLGKEVKLIMAPVPFDQTPDRQRWWNDGFSRSMVRDEYLKTIYYYARYWLSWGPFRDWLASFDTE